jgi:hypothetical protein
MRRFFMKFSIPAAAAAALLLVLAAPVPQGHAAKAPSQGTGSPVAELLRLLESKGIITGKEAGELEKKFRQTPAPAGVSGTKSAISGEAGARWMPHTPFVYENVLDAAKSLSLEGVISGTELQELSVRAESLNRGAPPAIKTGAAEKSGIGSGELESLRLKMPVVEVRDHLRFLAHQRVLSREEAGMVYQRYGRKYTSAPPAAVPKHLADAPYAHEEVVSVIDTITEQGVVSVDEGRELSARADAVRNRKNGEEKPPRERKPVGSDELPYRRTTLPVDDVRDQLKFLAYQRVMTPAESAAVFERFGRKYPTDQFAENISMEVKNSINSQMEEKSKDIKDIGAKLSKLPEWLNRFRVYGDMRLRYEGQFFDKNNGDFVQPSNPTSLMNSKTDRNMMRIRARLGFLAKVTDGVDATIALATGNTTNPVSTNQTLGDSLNKKSITLDQANLRWKPMESLVLWGGRFPNPWFSTDLVWDRDINFDGIAVQYQPRLNDSWGLFLTAGAFPLQEVEFSAHDKWIFGVQGGFGYTYSDKLSARFGVAYYHFTNTVGVVNDPAVPNATDWSAPGYQQKGNTLMDIDPSTAIKTAYASEFRELNVTASLDLGYWDPVHILLEADYVNNLGFNKGDVDARTGSNVKKETEGYRFGVSVGYPVIKEFGDWKASLVYKYLEADAVMDAFADSDFHLGGTNAKGWVIGADFGLTKNVWISPRWYSTNEISGPKYSIDIFQLDLNGKF